VTAAAGRRDHCRYHGDGVVNSKRTHKTSEWTYADQNIGLKKGEEMSRYLLGSAIVMLFRRGANVFNEDLATAQKSAWAN
jgi:phosphatidylserine decarboxylase